MHCSVRKQVEEFAKMQSQFKEGNIAFLLCEAIDHDEFELCRKKSNLFKRNGIIWKEDQHRRPVEVGIKPTAFVQFIRNQNGYQDFSSRKNHRLSKGYRGVNAAGGKEQHLSPGNR